MKKPAAIGQLATLVAVFGLAAFGCGAARPAVDPNRVLHVINRTTRTVGVEIGTHDLGGAAYDSAVRPCSDLTAVAGEQNVPEGGDLLVWLFVDPTTNLDNGVAQWSGDPVDLPGNYTALPIWSSGQIRASDLPRWVVVTPDGTSIVTSAPSVIGACGPLILEDASPVPQTSTAP